MWGKKRAKKGKCKEKSRKHQEINEKYKENIKKHQEYSNHFKKLLNQRPSQINDLWPNILLLSLPFMSKVEKSI
jgi:hypothetical protein